MINTRETKIREYLKNDMNQPRTYYTRFSHQIQNKNKINKLKKKHLSPNSSIGHGHSHGHVYPPRYPPHYNQQAPPWPHQFPPTYPPQHPHTHIPPQSVKKYITTAIEQQFFFFSFFNNKNNANSH